jgi:methyl-accepting chemotaxis protein
MLIKHKLIANTAILVTSMMVMLLLLSYASNSFQHDIDIAKSIGKIEAEILQLRRNEKDFIARKDLKYQIKFNKKIKILVKDLSLLKQSLNAINLQLNEIADLKSILEQYHQHFNELVNAQKVIGLNPKDGLYGNLRDSVHQVEGLIADQNYEILSGMLQLRRNEKDFMLRVKHKYIDKFNKNIMILIDKVKTKNITDADEVSQLLKNYQQSFIALSKQQKVIGFDQNDGLQGQMRNTIHRVDKILAMLVKKTEQEVSNYASFIDVLAYSIIFIVLVLGISAAFFIGKNILIGIIALKTTMTKVAKNSDLTLQVSSKNKDELADMATAFNTMLNNFRNLIVEVNSSVSAVNEATNTLSENITVTNQGVSDQMQETDMVATAVTEMVATIEEIASNTNEAVNKADTTNNNAEQGKQGVDATIMQIKTLSEKLIESETVVQELEKDSQTIGSVLDVIRGIAEQTNLLALNAAIEAARAGEQGRGFAVVADEVRTLASRTQDSTQEIESIINSLQGRTKNIVKLMAHCRVQGNESAKQAGSAGEKLEEINQDVSTIMEMNTAIATAIQEQTTVASEVNKHVVLIRDVAEQSGQSAIQNEQMSEELSQQAGVLHNEVSRFVI